MTLAHDVYRVMHLAKKESFLTYLIQLRDRQKTNFLKFQNDGKCALFRKPKNASDIICLKSDMHSIKIFQAIS